MPRAPENSAAVPVEPVVAGSGGLVIATDGTRDSDGAVRVGLALARRDGVKADVFSVVEAPSIVELDGTPVPDLEQLVEIAVDERGALLLAQRDRTHPGICEWPYSSRSALASIRSSTAPVPPAHRSFCLASARMA